MNTIELSMNSSMPLVSTISTTTLLSSKNVLLSIAAQQYAKKSMLIANESSAVIMLASHQLNSSTDTSSTSTTSTNRRNVKSEFYYDLLTVMMYSLIILVSLCGNSLVLRMIISRKKLQTTTNILIAWLAVSDLLTTTLNIPFNVARFLAMNYPFPALLCKLVPFIQVMCVYVSTFTMGVIAVHRYRTVTSGMNVSNIKRTTFTTFSNSSNTGATTNATRLGSSLLRSLINILCNYRSSNFSSSSPSSSSSFCLCVIMAVVWLLAGLLATPHSMFNQIALVPYQNKTYVRCRAEYPKVDFNFRFVLSVEAFLTQYMIPLGLICVLYVKIGLVVAKQGRVAQKANSQRRMEQDAARRRRLTMLILVVLVFGICWMPLNLYHLLVDFHLIKSNFTIFLFCHWIAMSSVCWNPFIYCWLNESFRKGAAKMFIFICCCSRRLFRHSNEPLSVADNEVGINNSSQVIHEVSNQITMEPISSGNIQNDIDNSINNTTSTIIQHQISSMALTPEIETNSGQIENCNNLHNTGSNNSLCNDKDQTDETAPIFGQRYHFDEKFGNEYRQKNGKEETANNRLQISQEGRKFLLKFNENNHKHETLLTPPDDGIGNYEQHSEQQLLHGDIKKKITNGNLVVNRYDIPRQLQTWNHGNNKSSNNINAIKSITDNYQHFGNCTPTPLLEHPETENLDQFPLTSVSNSALTNEQQQTIDILTGITTAAELITVSSFPASTDETGIHHQQTQSTSLSTNQFPTLKTTFV